MYIFRLVGLVPKLAICVTVTAQDGIDDNNMTVAIKIEVFKERRLALFFMIAASF
jgi:hypothetical protein